MNTYTVELLQNILALTEEELGNSMVIRAYVKRCLGKPLTVLEEEYVEFAKKKIAAKKRPQKL